MSCSLPENTEGKIGRRRFLAHTAGVGALALGPVWWPNPATAQTGATGCDYFRDNWSDTVKAQLAGREKRLHHFVWHATRNSWYGLHPDLQRPLIADLRWAPPRPSVVRPVWDRRAQRPETEGRRHWATENHAGEDFLYFHRRMIAMVDRWLKDEDRPPVVSWSDTDIIPPPGAGGCPEETVPAAWEIPGSAGLTRRLEQIKSDAYYYERMAPWQHRFTDYAHLRTLTLGELGARLEIGVHNNMHVRWSAKTWTPRIGGSAPWLREEGDIDPAWDDARYDSMLDEYSSPVNPLFWRLHKWIDNRINDWAEAHGGDVTPVKAEDTETFTWFETDGHWVNAADPWIGPTGGSESDRIEAMERVVDIITSPSDDPSDAFRSVPGGQAVTLRDLVTF